MFAAAAMATPLKIDAFGTDADNAASEIPGGGCVKSRATDINSSRATACQGGWVGEREHAIPNISSLLLFFAQTSAISVKRD